MPHKTRIWWAMLNLLRVFQKLNSNPISRGSIAHGRQIILIYGI